MKKEEFNLSEKIKEDFNIENRTETSWLEIEDIKEFIRLLKDEYMKYRDSFKTLEDYYRIFDDLEKLAGDKLK